MSPELGGREFNHYGLIQRERLFDVQSPGTETTDEDRAGAPKHRPGARSPQPIGVLVDAGIVVTENAFRLSCPRKRPCSRAE